MLRQKIGRHLDAVLDKPGREHLFGFLVQLPVKGILFNGDIPLPDGHFLLCDSVSHARTETSGKCERGQSGMKGQVSAMLKKSRRPTLSS